jgi:hypothetical protein
MRTTRILAVVVIGGLASLLILAGWQVRLAERRLAHASRFEVEDGNGITEETCVFQWLRRAPGSYDRLRHLLADGLMPGRLYGLCGLYLADPGEYERNVSSISDAVLEVEDRADFDGPIQKERVVSEGLVFKETCNRMRLPLRSWAFCAARRLTGR